MNSFVSSRAAAVFIVMASLTMACRAQTVRVLTAGAFKPVVVAVAPAFEASTGVRIVVDNDTAGALVKRVQEGESFDVLIVPPSAMGTLAGAGKVDAAGVVRVARVAIGVAVKAGAPHPPLATTEQFRQAVLGARKVAYIDPASGGSSGIYLDGLFTRLGMADAVRAKAVLVPGGLVAQRIATDEADLAIHQVSEILPVQGVELVGLLPDEIQNYTTYAAAVSVGSSMAEQSKAFVAFLASPAAIATIRAKGMLPPE